MTHVAVPASGDSRILAYYTLVTRTVDASIISNKKLPGGDIGVILLGRLAVDRTMHRQGLGKLCLLRAISQVDIAAKSIGIYALVLDALDDDARKWYLNLDWGFEAFLDSPTHLYLPTSTIRTLMLMYE